MSRARRGTSTRPFGRGDDGPAFVVLLAAGAALAASLVGGTAGAWALAAAAALLPPALLRLAGGRDGMPRGVLGGLGLMLGAGLATLLLPAAGAAGGALWLGLPPSGWAVLILLGLGPLVLVSWGYAASFGRRGPRA